MDGTDATASGRSLPEDMGEELVENLRRITGIRRAIQARLRSVGVRMFATLAAPMAERSSVPDMRPWPACAKEGCVGRRIEVEKCCLAHVDDRARQAVLDALEPEADLDLRGTPISPELLEQVLAAVQTDDSRPRLGGVRFDGAQFNGDARFDGAQFNGDARFDGAQFNGDARFDGAQFNRRARFDGAQFTREASFTRARFHFEGAFFRAIFEGSVNFRGAEFTRLSGRATFHEARFRTVTRLGPLLAKSRLVLDRATFDEAVVIEATTPLISCVGTQFGATATLRARWAIIMLDRASFAQPSSLSFATEFERALGVPEEARAELGKLFETEDPVTENLFSHSHQGDRNPAARPATPPHDRRHSSSENSIDQSLRSERPKLLSLRQVDGSKLVLSNVDLRLCIFQEAYNLDSLRIEGPKAFRDTPAGWKTAKTVGHGFPLWRWTRRQALTEEHEWRASRPFAVTPNRPLPPQVVDWEMLPSSVRQELHLRTSHSIQLLKPDELASLYRALRKAQEDNKNEPGAADFYYGEMEMRRKATSSWPERFVLTLYWLVSGYSLRGLRALLSLAIVIIGLATLLQVVGFNGGDPSFRDVLIYAAQGTLSLQTSDKALTEHVSWAGEMLRIILRLSGPVLLGLALLSIRNRVKR
jgi:hypothetical protein